MDQAFKDKGKNKDLAFKDKDQVFKDKDKDQAFKDKDQLSLQGQG